MQKNNNITRSATVLSKFFIAVLLACPLYVWGKKVKLNKAKEKSELDKWLRTLKKQDKEKAGSILASMKSGKLILMLGSFCPLFWISLISGQDAKMILFNLAHSAIYILLGYYIMHKSKKKLLMMKNSYARKPKA